LTDYILLKAAERYLERMQLDDQVRIVKALDALVKDSTPDFGFPLSCQHKFLISHNNLERSLLLYQ